MAVKLDQIVSHVEEVHFKLPPRNFSQVPSSTMSYNNSTKLNNQENRPNFNTNHQLVTINNDVIVQFGFIRIVMYYLRLDYIFLAIIGEL